MVSGKVGKLFYNIGDWLAKLIYLHLIWLFFTLIGFVVLGLFPATVGMFSVIRKWIMKEDEVPIYKTFINSYKSYFVEINILGSVYLLVGLFLYIDFRISYSVLQWAPLHIIIWLICVFYLVMVMFLFPIYVHYKLNKFSYLKQAFLIVLSSPVEVFLMLVSLLVIFYLFYFVPVMFIFAGSTIIGFPLMWLGMRAFNKVEKKAAAVNY